MLREGSEILCFMSGTYLTLRGEFGATARWRGLPLLTQMSIEEGTAAGRCRLQDTSF